MVLVVLSKKVSNLSTVGTVRERLLTPLLTADPAAQAGADHLRGSLALHPALADEVAEAGVRSAGTLLVRVWSGVGLVDGRLDVGDHTGACAWNDRQEMQLSRRYTPQVVPLSLFRLQPIFFTAPLQSRPPSPPPFHFLPLSISMFRISASHEVATHHFAVTSFSRQHVDTWHFLSPLTPHILPPSPQHHPLVERQQGFVTSHPGRWCEERHVARTSTPRGRCRCTDTGAGGPGSRSCSRCRQCGRRRVCPGRYSGLREGCTKER